MMLFHVRKCTAPEERVGRARGLLNFLAQIVPENDAYSHLLRDELERLRNIADYYILHEHLETVNEPVLFYDFAQAAAAKGLQFIAEAQSGARYHEVLGPAADRQVRQLASDLLEYEQYLDFMRNRMFRRSLLCRADVTLDRSFDTRRVRAFYVASPVVPEGTVDPATNDEAKFHIEGGIFTTPAPIVKAAMSILAARWPEAVAFEDLVSETHARIAKTIPNLDFNTLAEALAGNLAHSFIRQVVEFYATPPRVRSSAGDFPQTSELARLQASLHPEVTSQLHNPVTLDPFARKVVLLSNGTRSREQLIADLRQAVRTGEIKAVDQTGQTPSEGVLDAALAEALDQTLQKLARLGLLC
jgi:methyltransferase-like protein